MVQQIRKIELEKMRQWKEIFTQQGLGHSGSCESVSQSESSKLNERIERLEEQGQEAILSILQMMQGPGPLKTQSSPGAVYEKENL